MSTNGKATAKRKATPRKPATARKRDVHVKDVPRDGNGKWLPGQSANPAGRPASGAGLAAAIGVELSQTDATGRTNAQAVAQRLVAGALGDDVRYLTALLSYVLVKPTAAPEPEDIPTPSASRVVFLTTKFLQRQKPGLLDSFLAELGGNGHDNQGEGRGIARATRDGRRSNADHQPVDL